MAKPHTIRLRGPWDVLGESAPTKRVKLPTTWAEALERDATRATLRRRFHRPSILPEYERVFLCLYAPHTVRGVTLNDAPIHLSAGRCDITGDLQDANHLIVEFERREDAMSESLLDVWLEIEQR